MYATIRDGAKWTSEDQVQGCMLLIRTLVVGIMDNFLRPILIKRDSRHDRKPYEKLGKEEIDEPHP